MHLFGVLPGARRVLHTAQLNGRHVHVPVLLEHVAQLHGALRRILHLQRPLDGLAKLGVWAHIAQERHTAARVHVASRHAHRRARLLVLARHLRRNLEAAADPRRARGERELRPAALRVCGSARGVRDNDVFAALVSVVEVHFGEADVVDDGQAGRLRAVGVPDVDTAAKTAVLQLIEHISTVRRWFQMQRVLTNKVRSLSESSLTRRGSSNTKSTSCCTVDLALAMAASSLPENPASAVACWKPSRAC